MHIAVKALSVLVPFAVTTWLMSRASKDDGEGTEKKKKIADVLGASEEKADDLTLVQGLGPKSASVLHDTGITTYAQLAGTPVDDLREILQQAGMGFLDPASWPEQARAMAQEKEGRTG